MMEEESAAPINLNTDETFASSSARIIMVNPRSKEVDHATAKRINAEAKNENEKHWKTKCKRLINGALVGFVIGAIIGIFIGYKICSNT